MAPCFAQGLGPEAAASAATVEKQKPHFWKDLWGYSKDQVREKESAALEREDESMLMYNAQVAGIPGVITYSFYRDKLVSAEYLRQEKRQFSSERPFASERQLASDYLAEYQTLKTHLNRIYGKQPAEVRDWSNETSAWQRQSSEAVSLALGKVKIIAKWETHDSEIF